jgi:hypothetical protein
MTERKEPATSVSRRLLAVIVDANVRWEDKHAAASKLANLGNRHAVNVVTPQLVKYAKQATTDANTRVSIAFALLGASPEIGIDGIERIQTILRNSVDKNELGSYIAMLQKHLKKQEGRRASIEAMFAPAA